MNTIERNVAKARGELQDILYPCMAGLESVDKEFLKEQVWKWHCEQLRELCQDIKGQIRYTDYDAIQVTIREELIDAAVNRMCSNG